MVCIAGLTPAQVQLLMNAPAHQVNALAAQLGMLDTSARPGNLPGNLGAPAPSLTANQALLQQQKLAAARANFASQQAQRASPNPMLGLQQQQQPMLGLQQARQVRICHVCQPQNECLECSMIQTGAEAAATMLSACKLFFWSL